jgi:hypothetical protein
VRVTLIIHLLALEAEHEHDRDDIWEWVQDELVDEDGDDDTGDAFIPVPVMPILQESEGQLKWRQVQQALFDAFGV